MQIVRQDGNVTMVCLAGDLDAAVLEPTKALFANLQGPAVELDLRSVRYIDSATVALIMALHERLANLGGECRLTVRSASICARLVDLLRISTVLPVKAVDDLRGAGR